MPLDIQAVILDLQQKRDRIALAINALMGIENPDLPQSPPIPAGEREAPRHRSRQTPRGDGSDKICKKCHILKLIDEFPKAKNCSDGHLGTCKKCLNARYRARRAEKTGCVAEAGKSPIYPRECEFCHDPFSSYRRYKHHMKTVHNKEVE
jgi:hypothetical protein